MKLSEYFTISYGKRIYHDKTWLKRDHEGNVPLISSKGNNRGVYGYFDIEPDYSHIITIPSTGTVCKAFYQKNPCSVDDNTLVASPKIDLSDREMIFYSLIIRQYKDRFMYGRQVTPDRANNFEIPSKDEIPSWVYEIEIPTYDDLAESKTQEKIELPPIGEWKKFKYDEIFTMNRCAGLSTTEARKNSGSTPYVGASAENNGITDYSSHEPRYTGNKITVASDGSVGEAFYQLNGFNGTTNVTVLDLKNHTLTPAIAMFLITLIRKEQFKFNYGRKWGITRMKESVIKLPVTSKGTPDYDLMERYINSLPYSKYI